MNASPSASTHSGQHTASLCCCYILYVLIEYMCLAFIEITYMQKQIRIISCDIMTL